MSFVPSLAFSEVGGPAPFTVQLAPDQAIRVYSIVARWEGIGASGSFHPALSLYSQDDVLVSRTRPEQVLAAGDEAVVTYAPFLHSEPEAPAGADLVPYSLLKNSGDYAIYAVTAAPGQDPTELGANGGQELTNPVRSPDGTMVAFERRNASGFTEICVMQNDGSGLVVLDTSATTFMQWPAWRSDSAALIYTISDVGSNAGGDVYRIAPDGTGKTLLHSPAANFCARRPLYSFDDSKIAFVRHDDGFGPPVVGVQLWMMNADGSGAASIRAMLGDNFNQAMVSWASGSDVLCFYEGNGGGVIGGVYKINADGTGETLLNIDTNGLSNPAVSKNAWAEDDSRVYFTIFEAGALGLGWYLHEAKPDGTDENLLVANRIARNVDHFRCVWRRFGRLYFFPSSGTELASVLPDGTDYRVEHVVTAGGLAASFFVGTGFDRL